MTHIFTVPQMPRYRRGGGRASKLSTARRDYIDASGGAAVSCLGHSHPDVLAALHSNFDAIAYAHTVFHDRDAEKLADRLIETPSRIDHATW